MCYGAEIDKRASAHDKLGFLYFINDGLNSLRAGNRIKTSLMSNEEKHFMWNLAFFFTIKHGGANAFKVYYAIRSFITFHGIFMGPGYDLGDESVWRMK